ncbi:MAG TPA: hypothetical protein VM578_06820 [Candidatus Saccharimonadales bacterium]|nr:hypothetical protein [Candidatus Saccharimonadales bacterium]
MAVPVVNSAMATMRMNSMVSSIAAGISQTRQRAIMDSQAYTFVLTTPDNIYVTTDKPGNPVPLNRAFAINGGANATYTFTLCPNGTVYGAGGCPSNNTPPALNNAPPALTVTYQGKQTNINVSSVGNVKATTVH